MNRTTYIKVGAVVALAAAVASCGDGGYYATPKPPGPGTLESMFGVAFAMIFDASPYSQPVTPTDSSVPPLAPAGTPIQT